MKSPAAKLLSKTVRETRRNDRWKIREVVGTSTADRSTFYEYKGERAWRIQLTSVLAKQLAGYTLINKDLRNISEWLAEIERLAPPSERSRDGTSAISPDRGRYTIVKGLYVAALVSYGKCFVTCEGRRAQLSKKDVPESFRAAHEEIMRQRHNYAAHSGAAQFEHARVALALPRKRKHMASMQVFTELAQPDAFLWTSDEDHSFPKLVNVLRLSVQRRTEALTEKMFRDEIFPRGWDYWAARGSK